MPAIKSGRFTSLGKGERVNFGKMDRQRCDQFYDIPSIFNSKKPLGQAFSFGISRSYYEKVFCETNKIFEKNIPGPGNYEVCKKLGEDAPKFSLHSKIEKKDLKNVFVQPGPGQYRPLSINSDGRYPVSNYKNIRNIVFGSNKDKRFNYSCNLFFKNRFQKSCSR